MYKNMLKRLSAFFMCVAILFIYALPVLAYDELVLVGGEGEDEYEFDYDENFIDDNFWYSDEFGNPIDVATIDIQSLDISPFGLGDFLKSTAETMLSVLNSIGVYIKNDIGNKVEFAKNVYNALSGKSKAIIDEKSVPRGDSGGSFGRYTKTDEDGNEQDVFDISVDEYKTLKEDIKEIFLKSENGNQYYPFSYDVNCFNSLSLLKTSYFQSFYTGNDTLGKTLFEIRSGVIYTFYIYVESNSAIFDNTTFPRLSGYYYVDFNISYDSDTGYWLRRMKLHDSNVWSINTTDNTSGKDVVAVYFTYVGVAFDITGYFYHVVSCKDNVFSSSNNKISGLTVPHYNFVGLIDRIYIDFDNSNVDFSNVFIDNRVFNSSVIENNWQTLVNNDYNNSYQTFNVHNSDTYDYSSSTVESVINNYNIINNYNYYEPPPTEPTEPKPPTEPSEPIEEQAWFLLLLHSIVTWFDLLIDEVQAIPSHFPTKDDIYNYVVDIKYAITSLGGLIFDRAMDIQNEITLTKDGIVNKLEELKESAAENAEKTDNTIVDFALTLFEQMQDRTDEIVDSMDRFGVALAGAIGMLEFTVDVDSLIDTLEMSFEGSFGDLEDLIKELFVPNQENIDRYFADVRMKFDSKFGFVEDIKAANDDVMSIFANGDSEYALPKFEIDYAGHKMKIVDFSIFDDYIGFIRSLTVALLWAFFIFRTFRKLPQIIGGI